MKKLVIFLLLNATGVSTFPAQMNQASSTVSQNTIDWDDEDSQEDFFQKVINHYEQSDSQSISHILDKECYGKKPDLFNFTMFCALEKYAFEYVKQNPNAIDTFIKSVEKVWPSHFEDNLQQMLSDITDEHKAKAKKVGLDITDEQLKVLTAFTMSFYGSWALEKQPDFELFKEIAEYANQQIQ